MAYNTDRGTDHFRPVRRVIVTLCLMCLFGVFFVWRIDSPRVERLRSDVVDTVIPHLTWAMAPVSGLVKMADDFNSYARLFEQNQELRRELQRMEAWKEAALQLEQKNARLLDLNNVKLDPKLTFVTGSVLADSGSPFRQSVLLNVGAHDGIRDGWAAMDGIGLVGRISGVGNTTARVMLLTDPASSIPVTIQPSGQQVLLSGDNTALPRIAFLEMPDLVRPGDRVVSSGDGGIFPAGILIGQVAKSPDNRLRVRLAADYGRLEFLRVLRYAGPEPIAETGGLVGASAAALLPPAPLDTLEEADD
ncbi:rod shape-determining protein MreC [Meridianimarinicoccus aquatilis]|uniref:Cell shape-determining protein MreC n=1 Tax=Meridianimarinicoccus aquatilis TaxID=2552766 RepID=A0A4R6AXZ9_9RHOB|nr:rod shape-determining protein MreC [Fluviibacterium aquatile]QIE42498.1 rod shape-determining protein MreC [Rhodobacteraceae bacterium SC52]TDL89117.1 rod shape-determining protein MreC [Fluviibacterium aquatile]